MEKKVFPRVRRHLGKTQKQMAELLGTLKVIDDDVKKQGFIETKQ